MKHPMLLGFVFLISALPVLSQDLIFWNSITDNLGVDSWPSDNETVAPIDYYGELLDMSGGYQLGDTVADFTVYDFDGNALTLSEELQGEKPVVLINSSVSCVRFRNMFDNAIISQEVLPAREFVFDHLDDFNWVCIYNLEAHPSDGNCPSNCPPIPTLDTAVLQHPNYQYRRYAMIDWLESDSTFMFPFNMYCDNPDNSVYNNFFRRPFGMMTVNCEGIVTSRADWCNMWLADNTDFMLSLLEEPFQSCFTEVVGTNDIIDTTTPHIYPQPANNWLRVQNASDYTSLSLIDLSGRKVFGGKNTGYLDLSGIPAGTYVLELGSLHSNWRQLVVVGG